MVLIDVRDVDRVEGLAGLLQPVSAGATCSRYEADMPPSMRTFLPSVLVSSRQSPLSDWKTVSFMSGPSA